MQRGWSPACHLIITLNQNINPNPCCACLCSTIPIHLDKTMFLAMFYVCSKFPEEWRQGTTVLCSFLYEIIHPSGGSLLANTQVPVICSKCVILALVALFLGRPDRSHAVMCALLSLPLCPPWARSWSFELEPVHLWWWRNMPNSTMLRYRAWHWTHVSCGDEPGSF